MTYSRFPAVKRLAKVDRLGSIEQNEAEHSEHQGNSYFFKQRRSYYIYQKMIEQCISLYIHWYIMYYIITYISYMTWTIRDPQSLGEWWSLAARFPTATSFENFRSFGPFENNSWHWPQHLGFSFLATHREGRWSRRCVAAKHHTGPLAVGWLKTLEITVNYSGLCSLPWSTMIYHVYLVILGRWFPDFWYDSWQLLLLCLDCALRCWRRWASQFVSHKSWWGLGVLQVFSWKDWEGIYIDY